MNKSNFLFGQIYLAIQTNPSWIQFSEKGESGSCGVEIKLVGGSREAILNSNLLQIQSRFKDICFLKLLSHFQCWILIPEMGYQGTPLIKVFLPSIARMLGGIPLPKFSLKLVKTLSIFVCLLVVFVTVIINIIIILSVVMIYQNCYFIRKTTF